MNGAGTYVVLGNSANNNALLYNGTTLVATLTPTNGIGSPLMGTSVSMSRTGSMICVGGYGDNSNAGAVWVYGFDLSTTVTPLAKITDASVTFLGRSVYTSNGRYILVGATNAVNQY
jgi:hypothetical protein